MHVDKVGSVPAQENSKVSLPKVTQGVWTSLAHYIGASRLCLSARTWRGRYIFGVSLSAPYFPRKPPVLENEIWLSLQTKELTPKALQISEEQQRTWRLLAQDIGRAHDCISSPCLFHPQDSAKRSACHKKRKILCLFPKLCYLPIFSVDLIFNTFIYLSVW